MCGIALFYTLYPFLLGYIQHKAICDTISRISNRNAPKTNSLVQPFLSFGAFETAFGATVFGFGAFETAFGATIFGFGAFETFFGALKCTSIKNKIKLKLFLYHILLKYGNISFIRLKSK